MPSLSTVKYRVPVILSIIFSLAFTGSCLQTHTNVDENISDNRSVDKTQSPLHIYETYTNAEIGGSFTDMLKWAKEHGDSVKIMIYAFGYEQQPIVYHAMKGDTALVNNVVRKYGSEFLPDDLKLMWAQVYEYESSPEGDSIVPVEFYYLLALKGEPSMTGVNVASATFDKLEDSFGDQIIGVTAVFNEEGSKQLQDFTGDNIGRAIAIVYNDKIISYPTFEKPIDDGTLFIGNQRITEQEARDLVKDLNK